MLNPLRHQLASNSPLDLVGLFGAARTMVGSNRQPESALETLLCEKYEVGGAVLCRSGTEALVLALRGAEQLLGTPAVVALPSFSCFDVVSAAVRFGRPVLFYGVGPESLAPDPDSLAEAVGLGANVLVCGSLYGIPIDWGLLPTTSTRGGPVLVEDAAQGHGARWRGARLGGHGRLGVLSFGRGKGWTGGTGGALLVSSEEDARRLKDPGLLGPTPKHELRTMLAACAQWALGRPSIYGVPRRLPAMGLGETRYRDATDPARIATSAASLVVASWRAAEREARARLESARHYEALLTEIGLGGSVTVPEEGRAGFVRYPILLPLGLRSFSDPSRAKVLGAASSYPTPLPSLPAIQHLRLTDPERDEGIAAAQGLCERLVTLPTHGFVRGRDREALVRLLELGTRPA